MSDTKTTKAGVVSREDLINRIAARLTAGFEAKRGGADNIVRLAHFEAAETAVNEVWPEIEQLRNALGTRQPGDTWTVAVEIPIGLDDGLKSGLFDAVARAVHDWEPKDRDGWDADVTGHPGADVPATAAALLHTALHLRVNGERAPGGGETWADWERRTQRYLRGEGDDGPCLCGGNPAKCMAFRSEP